MANKIMASTSLDHIEDKLDKVLEVCKRLEKENAELRAKEEAWHQEKKRLVEKNQMARTRVESMISRLKRIEI